MSEYMSPRRAPAPLVGMSLMCACLFAACTNPASQPSGGSAEVAAPAAATGASSADASTLTACRVTADDLTSPAAESSQAPRMEGVSGKLAIDGSTALAPLINVAAQQFDAANGTQTTVTPNGSGNGLKDVNAGAVQIGMSDVFAQEKAPSPDTYKNLVDHQVAAVVFTVVVNNDLKGKVDNLTTEQIRQIFSGQVSNWSQLGGPNEAITVINRPAASGTRATFKKYVLGDVSESAGATLTQDTNGAVAAAIKQTPGAIGYVATTFVTGDGKNDLSPICIDGAKPTEADVNSGRYKYWGLEHAYTNGPATGNARAFLQYVSSADFQNKDVLRLGYYRVSQIAPEAIAAHTPPGAPEPEKLEK